MRWLVRNLVFAMTAIAGGYVGLVLHELVGHALPAYLFGVHIIAIRLRPDFNGSVQFDGRSLTALQELIVDAGGIAVNLVTGFGALLVERRIGATWSRRFLVVFGGISAYKALEYLATSFYDGDAVDPIQAADACTAWPAKGYWILPLLAVPFAIHPFARAMVRIERLGPWRLAAITAPTVVLGGLFYYWDKLLHRGDFLWSRHQTAKACGIAPDDFVWTVPLLPFVIALAVLGAVLGARAESRRTGQTPSS